MASKLLGVRQNVSIFQNFLPFQSTIFKTRYLHEGPDTVEELLDRHLVKKEKSLDDEDNELINRRRLTSTRREALSLYRDVLRATRFFMWVNSQGTVWRDVLRQNARKEFEDARFETDPEVVTRLLIGGRDAIQSALDKLAEKQRKQSRRSALKTETEGDKLHRMIDYWSLK